jgi:hypothetical protein
MRGRLGVECVEIFERKTEFCSDLDIQRYKGGRTGEVVSRMSG